MRPSLSFIVSAFPQLVFLTLFAIIPPIATHSLCHHPYCECLLIAIGFVLAAIALGTVYTLVNTRVPTYGVSAPGLSATLVTGVVMDRYPSHLFDDSKGMSN